MRQAGSDSPLEIERLLPLLRCPRTQEPLVVDDGFLNAAGRGSRYPLVGPVPILIREDASVFRSNDYLANFYRRPVTTERPRGLTSRLKAIGRGLARWSPSNSRNVAAARNYRRLAELLQRGRSTTQIKRVLVIGGAVPGEGIEALLNSDSIDVLETDVYIGPRTRIVCDGHDLPFKDHSFDGVVCQAVLEHVVDPQRVVGEIHRVLKDGGLVYSEVPFMQQVHAAPYDFQRFTLLGHRRLFRYFDELSAGATGGPGMALAWSVKFFLLSFGGRSPVFRGAVGMAASVAVGWLKFVDDPLIRRPASLDAAAGTFFLGRRRETPVADQDLIEGYRGGEPVARPSIAS